MGECYTSQCPVARFADKAPGAKTEMPPAGGIFEWSEVEPA